MADRYRRAGSRWRLLVHNMAAGGMSGVSQHFKSHPDVGRLPRSARVAPPNRDVEKRLAEAAAQHRTETIVGGTEFDELVVGRFLHVEEMGAGVWWMDVGGVVIHVRADRDGRPTSVRVDLEEPRDGVTYHGAVADD